MELLVWLILRGCLGKNTEISSSDQVLDSRIEILNISKLQAEGGYIRELTENSWLFGI